MSNANLSSPQCFCIKTGSSVSHFNASLMKEGEAGGKETVSISYNFLTRHDSESGVEPRSFCLPDQRLTARPNRLTTDRIYSSLGLVRKTGRVEKPSAPTETQTQKLPVSSLHPSLRYGTSLRRGFSQSPPSTEVKPVMQNINAYLTFTCEAKAINDC